MRAAFFVYVGGDCLGYTVYSPCKGCDGSVGVFYNIGNGYGVIQFYARSIVRPAVDYLSGVGVRTGCSPTLHPLVGAEVDVQSV